MRRHPSALFVGMLGLLLAPFVLGSCFSLVRYRPTVHTGGRLLLVGGGLDQDREIVYRRLANLARGPGSPRILVVTAASGDQQAEIVDKTEALRVWAPAIPVAALRREDATEASVAAIDAATALLFTGGDQSRITARYRPDDRPTPEWEAMARLLRRGGVIAGCSAGCAMMGQQMLVGGGSAAALGIAGTAPAGDAPPQLGPRVAPGMAFLPWAITDSHFFERDRVGRLVAALEATATEFGIGVGEDAACEIDIAERAVISVFGAALLVDARHLQRDGAVRHGLIGTVVDGGWVAIDEMLPPDLQPTPMPATAPREVPIVEPGQNLQLASWRLFKLATESELDGDWQLSLDGWQVRAWPMRRLLCSFCIGPR